MKGSAPQELICVPQEVSGATKFENNTWRESLPNDTSVPSLFDERYRPQLHFSAPRHWLSDPNGLVWHDGLYHLFFQHNPEGNDWGNMHWGHAVSRDLVHWQHRPVAVQADPWCSGFAFSGCVVVDHQNSSGLAAGNAAPMIALYTGATIEGVQSQCISFSLDGGDTWTQYDGNPVLANPGIHDFRDPKVFWNPDREEWVMILAVGDRLDLYVSENLLDWQHVSEFRCSIEDAGDVLECPDLFPLESTNGETHWVLVVSATNQTHHKDRPTRYFIGEFDGRQFDAYDGASRWIDYGPDNYASVTWSNIPAEDGRRLAIGWMSNWRYAREAPTYPWRGHMTIPRELFLAEDNDGHRLASRPVAELENLRQENLCLDYARADSEAARTFFTELPAELLDLQLEFRWHGSTPSPFGVEFSNETGDVAKIFADVANGVLVVDRTRVGQCIPSRQYARKFEAPLCSNGSSLDLRIVKDRASVEVFEGDSGAAVSANLFFDKPFDSISVLGSSKVEIRGEASILKSIWTDAGEWNSHV